MNREVRTYRRYGRTVDAFRGRLEMLQIIAKNRSIGKEARNSVDSRRKRQIWLDGPRAGSKPRSERQVLRSASARGSMATLLVRFPPLGETPMAIGPGHLWAAPARCAVVMDFTPAKQPFRSGLFV